MLMRGHTEAGGCSDRLQQVCDWSEGPMADNFPRYPESRSSPGFVVR
jgi:hypothetical protein